MKGLIELSNIAVGTVSLKCTTMSETEGEVEDTPIMYGKFIIIEFFKMKPTYDLYLMYSNVVELDKLYLFAKDYF